MTTRPPSTGSPSPRCSPPRWPSRTLTSRFTTPGECRPTFDVVTSQVVSASQFSHPDFERLAQLMFPGAVRIPWGYSEATVTVLHRKVWEFVYVLRAAEQHGVLEPGRRALGFGVGQEPIPAVLAQAGLSVVATDLDAGDEASAAWAAGAQHMSDLRSLSRPDVVPDEVLRTSGVDPIRGHERRSRATSGASTSSGPAARSSTSEAPRPVSTSSCARSTCSSPAAFRCTRPSWS